MSPDGRKSGHECACLDPPDLITSKVMDLFSFDPDTNLVLTLDLIYDTHPIRSTAGNKHAS